jgi:signal transduction histidine kinase
VSGLALDTGERLAVATVEAFHGRDRYTVLAASPLDIADESDRRIVMSLLAVFPALLMVSAFTIWLVVRRALRPVEAIRSQVASISSSDLSRRVPEPGTGDEIDRLASTMNEMLDRLQTSATQQRQFVGDASHELRSPLASLRGQLEVSTLENTDPSWAGTVAGMLDDHDRLERLIRDLLLLARSDEHHALNLEPVDLGYLVRHDLGRRAVRPGITRRVHAENCLVLGDTDALSRIVRNLVDNAERHARSAVTVEVHHGTATATTELVVHDDGDGIADDQRVRVFERFTRLDEARDADAGGSGLGLAIVAELVRGHHGTVIVEPTSSGARFVVRLPTLRTE